MTAKGKGKPTDHELRRALEILNQPDADEDAIDTAFETLVPLSSAPAPPQDFSRRVMLAVRQAPLAEGRVPLAKPVPDWPRVAGSPARHPRWGAVAALGAAAAAVAGGAVALFGLSATPVLVAMVALFIGTGQWLLVSVTTGLRIWTATATAGAVLADALTSPQMAIVLAATMLVGVLSLTALTQLLSTQQELSRWHNSSSLFV